MPMLQHYYTSCLRGMTGQSGFQTKAHSAGIPSQVEKTVLAMAGYRIPASLDARDIAHHPVALRYDYLGPNRCVLTCSQSNGVDEKGRNGNFFAHSVITSPDDFAVYPPIMFWRHPFWKTVDPSDSLDIPEEPRFEQDPSLELKSIWPFLEQPVRRDWFRKLLAATLQYPETKRPILILDETDNVALWIAAVTFALPPKLRPTLTFATYHHDPYSAPYCITGITKAGDSTFRFSPDEYISYFILNTVEGRTSAVEESVYAEYVCERYYADAYEDKLLDFFLTCNGQLPPRPQNASGRLDDITRFVLAVREGRAGLNDTLGQRAVVAFLNNMEAREDLEDEQLADLQWLEQRLAQDLARSATDGLGPHYARALALLKRHDPDFGGHLPQELNLLAAAVFGNRPQLVGQLVALIDELYDRDAVLRAVNEPNYLTRLVAGLPNNNLPVPTLFWSTVGRRLSAPAGGPGGPGGNGPLAALVHRTLQAIEATSGGVDAPVAPPPEAQALLDEMLRATADVPRAAVDAVALRGWKDAAVPYWLYYTLVGGRSLSEREPLRARFAAGAGSAMQYEIHRDVLAAGPAGVAAKLHEWAGYLARYPEAEQAILTRGVEKALLAHNGPQRSQIVHQLLADNEVANKLDPALAGRLLASFFGTLSLQVLTPPLMALYEKYVDFEGLNADQRALIRGCLAVTTQKIDQSTLDATRARLQRVDQVTYEAEVTKWMDRFFDRKVTFDEHLKMLSATYVPRHSDCFWALYWERLAKIALDRGRTAEFIDTLNFWFTKGLNEFVGQPFLAQEFFMGLPGALDDLRGQRGYGNVSRAIEDAAVREPWGSTLHEYLTAKKKSLLGLLKR